MPEREYLDLLLCCSFQLQMLCGPGCWESDGRPVLLWAGSASVCSWHTLLNLSLLGLPTSRRNLSSALCSSLLTAALCAAKNRTRQVMRWPRAHSTPIRDAAHKVRHSRRRGAAVPTVQQGGGCRAMGGALSTHRGLFSTLSFCSRSRASSAFLAMLCVLVWLVRGWKVNELSGLCSGTCSRC